MAHASVNLAVSCTVFQEDANTWNSNTSISLSKRSCKRMLCGLFIFTDRDLEELQIQTVGDRAVLQKLCCDSERS